MADEPEYLALATACIATHKLAIAHGNAKVIAASEVMLFVVGQMIAGGSTGEAAVTFPQPRVQSGPH